MTNKEELKYLTELVLEASKWRISEGDDRDPLRLEIEQRLATLTGTPETVVDGRIQATPVTQMSLPVSPKKEPTEKQLAYWASLRKAAPEKTEHEEANYRQLKVMVDGINATAEGPTLLLVDEYNSRHKWEAKIMAEGRGTCKCMMLHWTWDIIDSTVRAYCEQEEIKL